MLKLLKRFIKFVGAGMIGSVVDTLVLWLLSDFVFRDAYWGEYIASPILSFQCAVAVNFTISYFYVWKDRTWHSYDSGKRGFFKLFLIYDLSSSSVFLVRLGILLLIERFTGWDVVFCNLIAMCFSGLINFAINNILIFRRKVY